jgi:signal peptidase I
MNAFYRKVPKEEYYMMGDNRDNSADSRFWGTVPYKNVIGQPWFIYFSWDNETKTVRWNRLGTFINDLQHEAPRY